MFFVSVKNTNHSVFARARAQLDLVLSLYSIRIHARECYLLFKRSPEIDPMGSHREERDILGAKRVPKGALYGIFTTRAGENFDISGLRIDKAFITTLAEIKKAATQANGDLGLLKEESLDAILRAADEVITGEHAIEFPLDVFQAGAGTPWNMNMNEVIANRANQILGAPLGSYSLVHPNDHVNMSQSSNDVIPNAMRVTAIKLTEELIKKIAKLESSLLSKAEEFKGVMKSGRTHTQDAVPITLGQEFRAYSNAIANGGERIKRASESLQSLFLGGTAVGTGLNTHPEFSERVLEHLKTITGLKLERAEEPVEKTMFMTDFLSFMDVLAAISVDLVKICNDLMLLSSGPRTGLGEISMPEVEPGSSIMPGKVNPSIPESVIMVCFQVMGARAVVENSAMSGMLNLNVYTPVIAYNMFTSVRWLTNAIRILTEKCISGIEVSLEATSYYFDYSNAVVTLLNPVIGYEAAADLAKEALEKGAKIRDLVIEKEILSEEQMNELIEYSTEPNLHIAMKVAEEKRKG
jgi:aspartate ammonia-lyase